MATNIPKVPKLELTSNKGWSGPLLTIFFEIRTTTDEFWFNRWRCICPNSRHYRTTVTPISVSPECKETTKDTKAPDHKSNGSPISRIFIYAVICMFMDTTGNGDGYEP